MQPPAPMPVPPEPFEWLGANPAEWSTAVIALVALIVAAAAAWATVRTNNAQQKTLALQQRQYDEQQAGQVSYWVHFKTHAKVDLFIVNASSMPISNVMLLAAKVVPHRSDEVPLGFPEILYDTRVVFPAGPGPVVGESVNFPAKVANYVFTHEELVLAFTDGRGAVWYRNEANHLWLPTDLEKRKLDTLLKYRRAKPTMDALIKFHDSEESREGVDPTESS